MFYTLAGLLLGFTGCKEDLPDDLTFKKEPYLGQELRVDGVYRSMVEDSEESLYRFTFFYRNGVLRYGTSSRDSLVYQNIDWGAGNARFIWGLFKVNDDSIVYEQWPPEDTWIYSGEILNDTTFHIDRLQNASGSDVREHDETFHFLEYGSKPDSVSRFID